MKLKSLLDDFVGKKVMILGDMMVDKYILGETTRISPEAPVPIVDIKSEKVIPGGAANTANNISSLDGKVISVGVVGDDEDGKWLMKNLKRKGIDVKGIFTDKSRPTTTKTRIISGHQHIVRIDREEKMEIDEKLTHKIIDFVRKEISKVDAIAFSDYDKGLITVKLLDEVINTGKQHEKPIITDPKFRHFFDYKGVTIFKPNLNEASRMTGITVVNETSIRNMGIKILSQLECSAVLITRGENGMSLFEKNGRITDIPVIPREGEILDVTGAGDTVTATLSLALASGADFINAANLSNIAAGIEVEKMGTATVSRKEIEFWLDRLKIS